MESCSSPSSNCVFLVSILILCHFIIPFSYSITQPRCHDDERSALLQFKHSFVSTNSCLYYSDYAKVETWKLGERGYECCSWDGVECDDKTNHVISLDLSNSCLLGTLNSNSTLFSLVHLQRLNLAYNDIYSHIPPEIGRLSSLTHLILTFSYFSGQIPPQLSNLSTLVSLDLSSSVFSGQIPPQLSNLSTLVSLDLSDYYGDLKLRKPSGLSGLVQDMINLKELHLSYVDISLGVAADFFANFSSLESLRLDSCGLIGEFPTAIFQLPNLKILDLSNNQDLTVHLPDFHFRSGIPLKVLGLSGTNGGEEIFASTGSFGSLEEVYLSNCNFTRELPSSVGAMVHLKLFSLDNCNFSRQFASSIGNLVHLRGLHIYNSIFFTDKIPSSFGNLAELVSLSLNYNHFNPTSPSSSSLSWISKLTKLTSLSLLDINLNHEIFVQLINLTQLSELSMSRNQLSGAIPASLMNLTKLASVDLSHNQLSGPIPFQSNHHLTSLVFLDLSFNNLEGPIFSNLSHLQSLESLILHSNKLVGTAEFAIFSELKNLKVLDLSFNNLSFITTTLTSNVNLPSILGLASCNLIEFPSFLLNQRQWEFLDLSSNNITGQIPSWISKLGTTLDYLNLSHNFLTGFEQDPICFQNWYQLRTLDLRYNMLQGPLPLPPSSTYDYLISHNKLSGEVSPSICNLSSLQVLDLSFNNFSGILPHCLGNFSDSLSVLDLKGNNFHGSIHPTWRSGCQLKMISMSHNQLQGHLPKSLLNCSLLEFIDFGHNQIMDAFPSWLGILPELRVLILRSNGFHGTIKESRPIGFSNLRVIDLSHNNFSGKLPLMYFDMWNAMRVINTIRMAYMEKDLRPENWYYFYAYYGSFGYTMTLYNKGLEMNYEKIPNVFLGIDFSYNKFEGRIPDIIGKLKGLQLLNISGNNLNGHIPSSLANLKALECLDLSRNQLSGQIPMHLIELTSLSFFDVSFNHLSGPIPQGYQFCTFDAKSYEGNPGLWEETWTKKCGNFKSRPPVQPPSLTAEDKASGSSSKLNWLIVSMGYGSGVVVGVVAGNKFTRRRKHEWLAKKFGRKQRRQQNGRTRN